MVKPRIKAKRKSKRVENYLIAAICFNLSLSLSLILCSVTIDVSFFKENSKDMMCF